MRQALIGWGTALLLSAFSLPSAVAQAYPQKPVRIVVPYGAGGASDLIARKIGEKLTQAWNQPVLIENKAGGNTITGSDYVARSAPDGYTLLWTSNAHVIVPSLYEKLPYDWRRDFAPVTQVALIPQILVARADLPARNLAELVATAKQKPDSLTYGSSGSGSPGHLAGELFNETTGIRMRHVPYKGSGPALNDLLGGHIDLMFNGIPASIAQINAGKLKALGLTSQARMSILPQVPTIAQQGYAGYEASTWVGLFAPAKTPAAVVQKLQQDVAAVLQGKDVQQWLQEQGLAPIGSTPVAFQAALDEESARWGRVIKQGNIKPE